MPVAGDLEQERVQETVEQEEATAIERGRPLSSIEVLEVTEEAQNEAEAVAPGEAEPAP